MSDPVPPLHLVIGDEEFLAARAVREIVDAVRRAESAVEVCRHTAGELSAGRLAELLSPALFGDHRVVVLADGQDARKEITAALLAYATQPSDEVVLVVVHAGGAKGKVLADGLRKAGARVTTVSRISRPRDRVAFVQAELRRHGGQCAEETATRILDTVGTNLREIATVCGQLVADTGGRVDAAAVARYHRGRAEVTGFTVADAAMVGDVAGALEALRWALAIGVDPVPIADALADGVRTVARVAGAGRGSPAALASMLGMPLWKVERAQRHTRGWTGPALVTAMRAAATVNAEVKGAAEDRAHALERAVLAIAGARE